MVLVFNIGGCKQTRTPQPAQQAQQPVKPATEAQKSQNAPKASHQPTVKQPGAPQWKTGPTTEKVKLELYVMSQCPYGVQAEEAIKPIFDKMGSNLDFRLEFIGEAQPDGTFKSLHGENEVKGDMIQLCAIKYIPAKYMEFVSCMNKNMRAIPTNWESCATTLGLEVATLKTCAEGDEAKQLLKESFDRAKQRMVQGSPTFFIDDKPYEGGRSEVSFMRAICGAFDGVRPAVCNDVPPAMQIPLTVITDARCKECRAEMLVMRLKQQFEGLDTKTFDWSSVEAKKLCSDLKIKYLPVFLFGQEIQKIEGYDRFSRYLVPAGDYMSLQVGAKFDPTAEICDNNTDDNGDNRTDCADPTCKEQLVCRPEEAKRIDLFIMSQCPYGLKALDAMREVLSVFKDLKFQIHFIADETAKGFESMHGPAEVDEDIRELCAIKYYEKDFKFMDYIWCRNKNIRDPNWQACTNTNGIKSEDIQKCSTSEEGKQLLRDSIKLTNALGFGASPTWLANNKHKFSALNASQIQQNLCRYNQGLTGCDAKMSEQASPTPAGTPSCGH